MSRDLRLVPDSEQEQLSDHHAAIDHSLSRCDKCERKGDAFEFAGITWRLCYGCQRCWTASFVEEPNEADALAFADGIREATKRLAIEHIWDDQHVFWRFVEPSYRTGIWPPEAP